MKAQFCSYEIALRLKELGFNERCVAHWWCPKEPSIYIDERFANSQSQIKDRVKILCLAPLWQQVIGWLREKHGLLIHIDGKFKVRISNNTRESIGHVFTKDLQKSRHTLKMNGSVCPHLNYLPAGDSKHLLYPKNEYSFILEFPSYEEAQEYAILKAIELIS